MDLTLCTSGQLVTVTTLDAPLMVSAGAGSGKTFTLTQRIVHALLPGEDGTPAPLESIDQLLAITYTKKAAAELRARIKATLREEGLAGQALRTDDAWVSTIHSMAARLLRENALELGLDPAFKMVSEAEAKDLLHQAVDRVIGKLGEGSTLAAFGGADGEATALVGELLAARPLVAKGSFDRGIVDDVMDLLHRTSAMPSGLAALRVVPPSLAPAEALRTMYDLGLQAQATMTTWEAPNRYEKDALEQLEPALEATERWLADGSQASCGFDDASFDVARFRQVFYGFPATTATAGKKQEGGELLELYRHEYLRLADEVEGSLGQRGARALAVIAEAVDAEFRALKGEGAFDNDDLLRMTLRALEEHPAIAERYRRQFKLIMVDEFQDTDKVQVEVIRHLAAPGLANVCVVGDAQQSIYRFRGADINVFLDYREQLAATAPEAAFPALDSNFRSHGDVLAVVERIFAQPQSFGEGFLKLSAKGKVNAQPDPTFDELPRVAFDVIHYKRGSSKGPGVPKPVAVELAARHVAEHFATLHRQHDVAPGSMALLLGRMGNAQVYIDALREAGLDSIMVGGSVFSQMPEPRLIGALLRYAVNTQDEPALMEALMSPLFAISDDALLALAFAPDEQGVMSHRSFARAFLQDDALEWAGLGEGSVAGLVAARDLLRRFVRAARGGRPVTALRKLLAGSGLLGYEQQRGADGLAAGGNYAKALEMVKGLAADAPGIAELSASYDAMLASSKTAPGVLASAESQFVSIMTVHSSKGLQFDHVVVAEMRTGKSRGGTVLIENEGDATFAITLAPEKERSKGLSKLSGEGDVADRLADARTPGMLKRSLAAFAQQQEKDESRRLLYVAMTRAVKSLFVSYVTNSKIEDAYQSDGVFAEVHSALEWPLDAGSGVTLCDYGGSAPAPVACTLLTPESLEAEAGQAAARVDEPARSSYEVPLMPELPAVVPAPWAPLREGVRSYSSLEHSYDPADYAESEEDAHAGAEAGARSMFGPSGDNVDAGVEASMLAREAPEDATALGTAFHHLAQRAIIAATNEGSDALQCPDPLAVQAQVRQGALSEGQEQRLDEALDRWFGSDLAQRFARFGAIAAEVPFMVLVEGDGSKGPLYLEGEIDGLADDGCGRALLIDYKTGGSSGEAPEQLLEKHRQQASCYAYALLRQGFSEVEACFIRVEQPDPAEPTQPQVVTYRFAERDRAALEEAIYAAYA